MDIIKALRTIGDVVLDAILPPRARSARTKARSPEDIPLLPTEHDLLGARITTLMDYRDTAVQDLIRSLKYDGYKHAAHLAASLLADYLREEVASAKLYSERAILLVPVPLHSARKRERGFNQIALVLHALPEEFRNGTHATLSPAILTRSRATKAQTKLPRSERLSNVAGAFALAKNAHLPKRAHVFLIDDVTTTGATLVNAATPLKRAGAEVSLLALARA
ncbi:MAG: hypothetical protein U1D26_03260 [Patescibacteria group bacterium]|nr:hypothetical protein [Patescibacteria group bacterium]